MTQESGSRRLKRIQEAGGQDRGIRKQRGSMRQEAEHRKRTEESGKQKAGDRKYEKGSRTQ